jgi:hypothetical protein
VTRFLSFVARLFLKVIHKQCTVQEGGGSNAAKARRFKQTVELKDYSEPAAQN